MNASEPKYRIESANKETHYFSKATMKVFGDTMANFNVRTAIVKTNWDANGNYTETGGSIVECWALVRKKTTPKGCPAGVASYWDKQTLERVRGSEI